jgi:hypothetical protein
MATDQSTSTVVRLHRPMTNAERQRAYRQRQKATADVAGSLRGTTEPAGPVSAPPLIVTPKVAVTPSRIAPALLTVAAFGLAGVGLTMNTWFATSLGSTEIAGWLFAGIGVAADLVALAIPSCAARSWHARQRGTAAAGWLIWLAAFAFALIASVGFASVNIADTSQARASRTTPATEAAKLALSDAMTTRDRECATGTGKNCRAREEAVIERRRLFDQAMAQIVQSADPQIVAASQVVVWLSFGTMRPDGNDFAMLRLILLALLPQIGGILLMIARQPSR